MKCPVLGLMIAMLLAAMVFSGCIGNKPVVNTNEPLKTTEANDTGPLTKLEVKDLLGNNGQNGVNVSGNRVTVIHVAGDGRSLGVDKLDTVDIFEKLFKDPRIAAAMVVIPLDYKIDRANPLSLDDYQDSANPPATFYVISRKAASTIDWDHFSAENVRQLGGLAYENPLLSGWAVNVITDDSWSGSFGGDGNSRTVEGDGNQVIPIPGNPWTVVAVVQKQTGYSQSTLKVQILKDGEVKNEGETEAAYGVVTVSS